MKHIVKKSEPEAFVDWKANWPDLGSDNGPGWSEFDAGTKQKDGTSIKQKVKSALLDEQGGICCFCENRVGMDHGHIAHLDARSGHDDRVLAYDNLLYSCPENPRNEPQTCGHAQGTKSLPVSPLQSDCELRFKYASTGSILPGREDDTEAIDTIRILNLNDRRTTLFQKRAEVFQAVEDYQRLVTAGEFELWINEELERQSDGTFKPFWTTRKYAAGLYP